jgi:hypothetical protein
MPWARLDDNFHSHPKTYIAGLDGCGLFCKSISYAAHYLTDGFVPREWIMAQLPATKVNPDERGVIERLVAAGMFTECDGGYMIHGYLDLNPSKVDVERDRAAAADRKRKSRGPRANSGRRSADVTGSVTQESRRDVAVTPGESNLPHSHTHTQEEPEGSSTVEHPDFAAWLTHHEAITGQRNPGAKTKAREKVAAMYRARRDEDYSAEDLCLATVGAFNDPYRRENGHYGCVSVLRPEKVHDLIEKGRRGKPVAVAQEHPVTRNIRELEELKQRLRAEEEAAA